MIKYFSVCGFLDPFFLTHGHLQTYPISGYKPGYNDKLACVGLFQLKAASDWNYLA